MDKRKLRYARKKTKERILRQRSRRFSQGSGQDGLQAQQEEKQVSPESYAEQPPFLAVMRRVKFPLMTCWLPLPSRKQVTRAAKPTGDGMALTTTWIGVPSL